MKIDSKKIRKSGKYKVKLIGNTYWETAIYDSKTDSWAMIRKEDAAVGKNLKENAWFSEIDETLIEEE